MIKPDTEHYKNMVGYDCPISMVTGVGMEHFDVGELCFYWGQAQRERVLAADESAVARKLRLVSAALAALLLKAPAPNRLSIKGEGVEALMETFGLIVTTDTKTGNVTLIPVDLSEGGSGAEDFDNELGASGERSPTA